jgi:uncharacterized protein (TIGR00369 family)
MVNEAMTSTGRPGLEFPVHVPFIVSLGLELHRVGDGESEVNLDLADSHLNSFDVAHGGVVMTLLDVAMAMAARSSSSHAADPKKSPGVVTIEMKTSFMRPAEGRLRAIGKLLHRTATLAFCEATLFDAADRVCAQASGTFKILRALPGADRSVKNLHTPPTGDATP